MTRLTVKKLTLLLLLSALPLYANLPDPNGPNCLIYAQWAYVQCQHDSVVKFAAIVGGTLATQSAFSQNTDVSGSGTSFGEVPAMPQTRNHAICVWEKNREIWVEDTQLNAAAPYRCPDLTKRLRAGETITPEIVFSYLHRHSTAISVLEKCQPAGAIAKQ
jgi:hypothetical protein